MDRAWWQIAGFVVASTAISCGRASSATSPITPPPTHVASGEERPLPGLTLPPAEASSAPAASGVAPAEVAPPADVWSELDIPGHEPAIVSLPGAATGPAPVVVTAHGLGEDPKQWCEWCRELVGHRPVILCLRGSATGRTASQRMSYSHTSPQAMRQEAMRGLQALRERHPDKVDAREALFVGFSLGANTGAQVVLEEPAAFPRAVLIEGGNEIWDRKTSPRFHAAGGRRILFACGTEGCRRWAEFSRRRLVKAGVEVKTAIGDGGGHSYRDGPVGEALRAAFSWAVEDDPRWELGTRN